MSSICLFKNRIGSEREREKQRDHAAGNSMPLYVSQRELKGHHLPTVCRPAYLERFCFGQRWQSWTLFQDSHHRVYWAERQHYVWQYYSMQLVNFRKVGAPMQATPLNKTHSFCHQNFSWGLVQWAALLAHSSKVSGSSHISGCCLCFYMASVSPYGFPSFLPAPKDSAGSVDGCA